MVANDREDVIYHEVKATGPGAVWWIIGVAGVGAVLFFVIRRRTR